MHEGVFTEQIVNAVLAELKKLSGQRPRAVRVVVGEVFHLQPESVQFHFEVLTKGTPLEGVELQLTEEPMRVKCTECGAEGEVEDHHLLCCPACCSAKVTVLCGNQIRTELLAMQSAEEGQ